MSIRPRAAAVPSTVLALLFSPLLAGPAHACPGRVTVRVHESCQAPLPGTNYCAVRGTLADSGVGGADIVWEVVVLRGAATWDVQLQAFSEGAAECLYPIRAKGTLVDADGRREHFVTESGFATSSSSAVETLELQVRTVRIGLDGTC